MGWFRLLLSFAESLFGVVSTQSKDVSKGVLFSSIVMEALQTEAQFEPEEQLQDTVRIYKAPCANLVSWN